MMTSEKNTVARALRGEGEVIGALVMWNLHAVTAPRARFEQFFGALGFDGVRLAPKRPGFAALIKRAAAETRPRLDDGWLLREASSNAARCVFACVREQRNESAALLTHSQEASVAAFADWSIASTDAAHPAAAALIERYTYLRDTVTSVDISRAMVATITHRKAMGGVCFTGRGGAYFVHPDHLDTVRAIAHWVRSHGDPRTDISIFEIGDNGTNREQAAAKLERAFADRCAEILTDCRAFVDKAREDAPEGHAPDYRELLVERRAQAFDALQDRVDRFQNVLGSMSGELAKQIEGAKRELYRMTGMKAALVADFGDDTNEEDGE